MSLHRHHHAEGGHPAAHIALSILRLSVAERLAAVTVLIVVLWAAAFWALT
jgi:hypothetical protein